MREAAIERKWHAAVLSYGHQARAARSGNPDGARALLFATMGYPPPFPHGWDQASAMMLADEAGTWPARTCTCSPRRCSMWSSPRRSR